MIPIVGLDLSTTNCGVAAVTDPNVTRYHSVKPTTEDKDSVSLLMYADEVVDYAVRIGGPGACVFIENTYMGANAKVALMLAEFRGMVMGKLELKGVSCFSRPMPSEWKAFCTGNGGAKKEETIGIVQTWGFEVPKMTPKSKKLDDNVADAICIAHFGWAVVNGPIEGIGLARLLK